MADRNVATRTTAAMQKVNLSEKLARFSAHWQPKVVGELNGQQVKLAKFKGPFVWHSHEHEDELFLVVRGHFRMEQLKSTHDITFYYSPPSLEHEI